METLETPDQLALKGKQLYEQESLEEAAQIFEAAAQGYQAAGDSLAAAEMANNRSVVLLQSGNAQAALEAVGDTAALFESAGDTRRRAMAIGNKAAALAGLGEKEAAEKLYWESAELLADAGEPELRASVLQAISRLQLGKGRYMEALASMEAGLDGVKKPSFSQRILKKLVRIPGKLLNR